jgi:hypothetical protein
VNKASRAKHHGMIEAFEASTGTSPARYEQN